MTKEIPKIYRKAFHALKSSLSVSEMRELFESISKDQDENQYNYLIELIGNEVVQHIQDEFTKQ